MLNSKTFLFHSPNTSLAPRNSPAMFGATSDDIYSDAGPGNSLDLDTDRPLFSDDPYNPSSDSGNLLITIL